MSEDEIIGTLKHWIEYEKVNKDKINKADELIEIQQGLLDLYQEDEEIIKRLNTEYETAQGYILALKKSLEEEKEKNKELEYKINQISHIIDTNPYTAYTLYGDILYDDQAIRDVINDTHKFKGELFRGGINMRDKKRIKPFMNELAEIWEENCPDWRFGQLMINVLNSFKTDSFFYEEKEMLEEFKKYFNK